MQDTSCIHDGSSRRNISKTKKPAAFPQKNFVNSRVWGRGVKFNYLQCRLGEIVMFTKGEWVHVYDRYGYERKYPEIFVGNVG